MTVPNNTAVAYGPADVLEVAARVIERSGLWQGEGSRGEQEPTHCPITAFYEIGKIGVTDELLLETLAVLKAHLGVADVGGIYHWNDTAESADVVTGALRAAAAGLGA